MSVCCKLCKRRFLFAICTCIKYYAPMVFFRFIGNKSSPLVRAFLSAVHLCVITPHFCNMFGRGSLFDMLGEDFTRDPFFQDPFRYMQSQAGFPDPAEQSTAWSSAAVPQRGGREVSIAVCCCAHMSGNNLLLLWLTLGLCRCLLRPRAAVQHVVRRPSPLASKRLMET